MTTLAGAHGFGLKKKDLGFVFSFGFRFVGLGFSGFWVLGFVTKGFEHVKGYAGSVRAYVGFAGNMFYYVLFSIRMS